MVHRVQTRSRAAASSDALVDALCRVTDDALLVTDSKGAGVLCNLAFSTMFGITSDRIGGLPAEEIFREAEERGIAHEALHAWLDRVLVLPDVRFEDEISLMQPPGRRLHLRSEPILTETGAQAGRVWRFREKALLPTTTEEVGATMYAVGMLATGIAHDVRNILTALRMEMAEQGPSPCKTSTLRQVNRLEALTHSLLAISEEERFHSGPIDLSEVLLFVFRLLREQAETDGIELRTRLPRNLPPVQGNARRLEHLFVNLLRNAIFAVAPTGGTITLTAREEDGRLLVQVQDTGPGILPENLPHLFEPFFTTQLNRTGLGLFVAKRIVAAHGGEITVTNRRQGGTCVSVWLPIFGSLEAPPA